MLRAIKSSEASEQAPFLNSCFVGSLVWQEIFKCPKYPDPSKLAILRTLLLLYRFKPIGGSNDP